MVFEEENSVIQRSRSEFADNVSDSFGQSICEELFDKFSDSLNIAENFCQAADVREAFIRAQLMELRLII